MRFSNFVFGVALLLVATTLALTITFRNAPREKTASERPSSSATSSRTPSTGRLRGPSSPASRHGISRTPRREGSSDVEDLDLVVDDSPSTADLTPAQRQKLSQSTPAVKRAALAKLDRMTERFDLTSEQRRKIFPLLVESTPGYHPAMVVTVPVGGVLVPVEVAKGGQSPDEAIHDALDPEQQADFVEAQLDERAWWNEIVTQLEEDFDGAVAAAGTAPPEEEPLAPEAPVDPDPAPVPGDAPKQGDNIFDLLK